MDLPWIPDNFSRVQQDASDASLVVEATSGEAARNHGSHFKDLTETGNRLWKISGTHSTIDLLFIFSILPSLT